MEIWREIGAYLAVVDLLGCVRICSTWQTWTQEVCDKRWESLGLRRPAWVSDIRELWRRVLDPSPCCLLCGRGDPPTSMVVLCTCLRSAGHALGTLRFHHRCWDCTCFRYDCSVVLMSCPLCHKTRVGWRRLDLEF